MGRDKAWIDVDGRTMLQRIVQVVNRVIPQVLVVGAEGQALPALPDSVCVVRDLIPDAGPLGGLSAAFASLHSRARNGARSEPQASACATVPNGLSREALNDQSSRQVEAVFVCGCDFPSLCEEVIRAMLRHYDQVVEAAARMEPTASADHTASHPASRRPLALVPVHDGRPQPLLAVYSVGCAPILERMLIQGERRARTFADACETTFVSTQEFVGIDPSLASFVNANTPDDLRRLRHTDHRRVK